MNKKFMIIALAGILAIGGTLTSFASTTLKSTEATKPEVTVNEAQATAETDQKNESNDPELTALNTVTAITEEQAKQLALTSIKDGIIKRIELEDEDGVIVYGIEVQSGDKIYDVKVDANTGAILKSEIDSDKTESTTDGQNSKESDQIEHENSTEDPEGYED